MSSAIEPVIEPAIVLAAYAEPIASGRRVLFVGPASSALPARLVERGARVVLVCDPDPVRLAEATVKNRLSAVSFSALGDGNLALRDGAFDVCLVEDAGITEPLALVKKLRRALTPRGVAILATLNPETRVPLLPHRPSGEIALDYYALYDAVKAEFEHVRMLGQAPFVGYVIADFAPEGAPEPSLDTAFLPSGAEEPELFVAVASQQPIELEAFAVVQLPYRAVVSGTQSDSEALRRARSAESATRTTLTERDAELERHRRTLTERDAELERHRHTLTERDAELERHRRTLTERDAELERHRRTLTERDAELEHQRQTAASGSTALENERQAIAARDAQLREAETRLFARDTELVALRRELENKNRQLEAQDGRLVELEQKLARAPSPEDASAAAADLSSLEQALAERGEHVRKLERELREAERVGKELLRQLPHLAEAAQTAQRAVTESELAQKLAKAQADLIATRWALEAAVKHSGASETPQA